MSADRLFVDTSILVSAMDGSWPQKQALAQDLLDQELDRIVLSAQVLGEFYVAITRKLRHPVRPEVAAEAVEALAVCRVEPVSRRLVAAAIERSARTSLSFRDAQIVEAALTAGAAVLLSEDFPLGRTFDGLRVENPFRDESPSGISPPR